MSTPTAIGFDMGATSTKTGVVRDGKILTRGNVIETRQDGDTAALIDAFIQEIRRLKEWNPEVEAVGFGVPGIINPVQGVVVNLTNVKGWSDIPLRSIIMRADRSGGKLGKRRESDGLRRVETWGGSIGSERGLRDARHRGGRGIDIERAIVSRGDLGSRRNRSDVH